MIKSDFMIFYNNVVKKLGERFAEEYPQFSFCDNHASLYEEYLNQKTMLRVLYEKEDGSKKEDESKAEDKPQKALLDRHKVCACITTAIIKIRLLSLKIHTDENFKLSNSSRINEQLAFMSSWELFKGFVILNGEKKDKDYKLPKPFHNDSFTDTITRSLFFANQLNSLSTPLIANIFYLLEMYCSSLKEENLEQDKEDLEQIGH